MSEVKQRGRRRASSPATHELSSTPGSSFHGSRREALAAERAQAPAGMSVSQLLRAGASSGAGQRVGVAMAATGLVMAVSLQGTQATEILPVESSAAAVVDAVVTAGADVPIAFATPEVASALNPDGQLKETLKVNASNVTAQASKGTLSAPLENLVTSSPFGYRISPITGQLDEKHTGQDFAIQCGNEVLAAAGGVVTFSGWHDFGGGNRVVVDHGNGLSTSYNHMSKNSVTVGQKVARGELVGLSGTTGASTGCHLHFEVIVDDETVDPMDWL
ncbi:M23 family metallopeptidase [Specibacter sp. NPDC057265]|uniref:M23 family metallopeptidase n=1 Tax=Specibacter sp. NPDC057265 TaxID=3346075 RepID=UPI00363A3DB7